MTESRVIFVTGAGTGIGRGIAEYFADQGDTVVIAGRRAEPLTKVAHSRPGKITPIEMDLADRDQRREALGEIIRRHGRLDVLVNNAAVVHMGMFAELTFAQIAELLNTNLLSTMMLTHEALPLLRTTHGNIVIISSTSARHVTVPSLGLCAYAAAKAGLNQFTRVLATEVGSDGVRVNAVSPGFTRTEAMEKVLVEQPDIIDSQAAMTAMGRVGEPIDIARAVGWLASKDAGWVTGQILDVSGGYFIAS
jgi:meso-butanediol dehydrogenase/(S,S)-butanediol dehydrogenase/diacetyl reductase